MKKSTQRKLREINDGEAILIGDIITESHDERDCVYTVYKVGKKAVSAYGQHMQRRFFPKFYNKPYCCILGNKRATVQRWQDE